MFRAVELMFYKIKNYFCNSSEIYLTTNDYETIIECYCFAAGV